MAIWEPIIEEYFKTHTEGTTFSILEWARTNKREDIIQYIEQYLSNGNKNNPHYVRGMGNERHFQNLMKADTLRQPLERLAAKGLLRKESNVGMGKWKFIRRE